MINTTANSIKSFLEGVLETTNLNYYWKAIPNKGEQSNYPWAQVTIKRGSQEELFLEHVPSQTYYKRDSHDWALMKNISAIWIGEYVYGLSSLRHVGEAVIEGAQKVKAAWDSYRQLREEPEFNIKIFVKNELSNFKNMYSQFSQAGKFGLIASALFFEPILIGVPLAFYACYNPIGFRRIVNGIDDWCRDPSVVKISDDQIQVLGVWGSFKAMTTGSYPLSHILNMHSLPLEIEEKKEK